MDINIILILVIIGVLAIITVYFVKNKKKGCSCGKGGCSCCPGCNPDDRKL